jgi:hypothetical protein
MHDAKNRLLKPGDQVLIPAYIEHIYATEDYCNVTVVTALGRRPDGTKITINDINTAVTLRSNTNDDNDIKDIFQLLAI